MAAEGVAFPPAEAVAAGVLAAGADMAAGTADTSSGTRRAGRAARVTLALLVTSCGPSASPPSAGGGSAFDWLGRTVPSTDAQAMVVKVDPGATLTVSPGQGVGVFVEYQAGGHWRTSWSCDTQITGQACQYQVTIVARGAAITSPAALVVAAGDSLTQPAPEEMDVATFTSTDLDGVTFDAPAGAPIDVDVVLDGAKVGVTFFFVQDGKVDGGYMGALTDPLVFEPQSP